MIEKLVLGIMISGYGSNMHALVNFVQAKNHPCLQIGCVISDQPQAGGLEKARSLGIEATFLDPGHYKTKLSQKAETIYVDHLKSRGVNLVCLAGFMRVVKSTFIEAFPNQIINIHPSLLPSYPGLRTHERVLQAGEKFTGCTVHFVDEGIDTGKIIMQEKVTIYPQDTPDTLARRVIQAEHRIYCEVIDRFFRNLIH